MNLILFYLIIKSCIFNFISGKLYSKTINEENVKDIILLPSRDYFVLFDKGIYIYNINFTLKETIYNFTNSEKIVTHSTSELKVKDKYFISIFNYKSKFLYIYEVYNKIFYNNIHINLIIDGNINGDKYNIISYKYENSTIEYIIYFITHKTISSSYFYIINYFRFNIDLLDNTTQKNITKSAYTYLDLKLSEGDSKNYSSIHKYYISCHYVDSKDNKKELICFYFTKICNTNVYSCNYKITANYFDIENSFNSTLYIDIDINNDIDSEIISIPSKNNSKFFVCFSFYCTIYDNRTNELLRTMQKI